MKPPPKKRFGQHFLRDTGILDRLERVIRPSAEDYMVEIGAGDGTLSVRLARSAGRFTAIEVDSDQMPALESTLAQFPGAKAMQGDILGIDLDAFLSDSYGESRRVRFAGNLPYNIATAIIHRLLRLKKPVVDMTFMVQLEVAQRIVASPGSRTFGYLSLDCQHRSEVGICMKVAPACFVPRPKVMSAVLTFKPRGVSSDTKLDICFDDLVKAAFAHRRKTLSNSLRRHPGFGPVAESLLMEAGIDRLRRAEDLSLSEYERLAGICHSCFMTRPPRE